MKNEIIKHLSSVILAFFLFFSLKAQQLYVGANYHPHDDKNIEKIEKDIQLMKSGGLTVVRMGHLAWDSYEPSEGQFDFKWFDRVMDLMSKAG
ncbi:MAG TPA: beta-galactosidase, partial [Lacibacter sp.]|nr:beta-galactosidase [Lacibacter sp.]